jgi:SAM-dependent methyltransferase
VTPPGSSRAPGIADRRASRPHARSLTVRGIPAAAVLAVSLAARATGHPPAHVDATAPDPAPSAAIQELRAQGKALEPLVRTDAARRFLRAVAALPPIAPRTILVDAARTTALTEAEAAGLPESERTALHRRVLDDSYYYTTRYGSPLAYARPLDLVAAAVAAATSSTTTGATSIASTSAPAETAQPTPVEPSAPASPHATFTGARILDFGYGSIGHLRLLASLGADVVGVEVDPVLRALYSFEGDQGAIPGFDGAPAGTLTLVHGRWPADHAVAAAVNAAGRGGAFDLIIAKNVLKNGYLHPAQPVDKRMLVDLGVDDSAFVAALAAALRPGGLLIIYNLCPPPSPPDKPYIPWADGRSPFPHEMLNAAGFDILAFDQNDDAAARALGHALGWDQGAGAMTLETDLFALYTLARRR